MQYVHRKKDAVDHLRKALLHLRKEEVQQLFEYIREWNTKPRLCHNAQFVLFQVFSMLSPTDIVEVGNFLLFVILVNLVLLNFLLPSVVFEHLVVGSWYPSIFSVTSSLSP